MYAFTSQKTATCLILLLHNLRMHYPRITHEQQSYTMDNGDFNDKLAMTPEFRKKILKYNFCGRSCIWLGSM